MNLIVEILSAILWRMGGDSKENFPKTPFSKKPLRVVWLPLIIGFSYAFVYPVKALWTIGAMQIFRVGYGEDSFLAKFITVDWQRRAFCGLLYSAIGGSFLLLGTGHYQAYVTYIIINTGINGILCFLKANVEIQELSTGFGIGLIKWLV